MHDNEIRHIFNLLKLFVSPYNTIQHLKKMKTKQNYFHSYPLFFLLVFLIITGSNTTLAANNAAAASDIQKNLLGKPLPDFVLPDINNKQQSSKQWRNKLLIINFWATWCTPCRKEIPIFNQFQTEFADDGIQFIGIAIDNAKAVRKFIQTIPVDYINLIGGNEAITLAVELGNITGSLPFTVIADDQGKIRSILSGKLTEKYLRKTIEKLLY